jgi:hypothetical protein
MAWFKKRQPVEAKETRSARRPAPAGDSPADDVLDPEADELHFCCICGGQLGFDFEDELNGEGWGRDICGACNRSRNDDSLMMGW